MVPEFASNIAHCDHIPVLLIRLRPRVKLGTRNRLHLLVGEMDIVDAAWWAEQQRLRFFESPMEEDAADEIEIDQQHSPKVTRSSRILTGQLRLFDCLIAMQSPQCTGRTTLTNGSLRLLIWPSYKNEQIAQ